MKMYPSLTDRLATQHESIENILSSIDERRLLMSPQKGKWNIHANIAHLARYQPLFIERINQILLTEEPFFGQYKAEDDPEFEYWVALDIDTLIRQINTDRKDIRELITGLNESQLNRMGVHKKYGSLNVIQWAEFFLLHEAHHLFAIFQLAYDTEL